MKIIVPATSANIGPGFDSVGVAVSKYLEIEVLEESQEWVIEHDLNPRIPTDKRNLLIKISPGPSATSLKNDQRRSFGAWSRLF